MTDLARSIVVVGRSIGKRFVFSTVDHYKAFVVTVKSENPYAIVQVHCTVVHSPETLNCTPIQLV